MKLLLLMVVLVIPLVDAIQDSLSLTTDQLIYKNGDLIEVSVTPSDEPFTLQYANASYPMQDRVTLEAIYPYNRLTIVDEGNTYDRIIHVKNEDVLPLLFPIFIFGGFNYLFTHYLRNYIGGL